MYQLHINDQIEFDDRVFETSVREAVLSADGQKLTFLDSRDNASAKRLELTRDSGP